MIKALSLDIDYIDRKGRRNSTHRKIKVDAQEIKGITWSVVGSEEPEAKTKEATLA